MNLMCGYCVLHVHVWMHPVFSALCDVWVRSTLRSSCSCLGESLNTQLLLWLVSLPRGDTLVVFILLSIESSFGPRDPAELPRLSHRWPPSPSSPCFNRTRPNASHLHSWNVHSSIESHLPIKRRLASRSTNPVQDSNDLCVFYVIPRWLYSAVLYVRQHLSLSHVLCAIPVCLLGFRRFRAFLCILSCRTEYYRKSLRLTVTFAVF